MSEQCHEFRCPKCGGWAFSFIGGRYQCNSDMTGMHLSMTDEEFDAGLPHGKREKPCGWNGFYNVE